MLGLWGLWRSGVDEGGRGGDTTMDSEWTEKGTCLHDGNQTHNTRSVFVTQWSSGGGSRQINRQTYTHTPKRQTSKQTWCL